MQCFINALSNHLRISSKTSFGGEHRRLWLQALAMKPKTCHQAYLAAGADLDPVIAACSSIT